MFAVGDDKQSIFSFQGAAPEKFGAMRQRFRARLQGSQTRMAEREAADLVPVGRDRAAGGRCGVRAPGHLRCAVVRQSQDRTRSICPDKLPGHVDIWPLVLPDKKDDIEGWDAPFDTSSESSPQVRLAKKIAAHVTFWQHNGTRPGDVLILVRQRGPPFRSHHPPAESRRHPGCRRRPHGVAGSYRGDGSDRAGRCAAAARGRSRARVGAEEPTVRAERGRPVRNRA